MSETPNTQEAVDFYIEKSKLKSNGIREVPKAVFVEAMEKHGVTEEDYKKVQDAVNFETTVAARVALSDVESKIKEASEEDLKSEEFRKGISATVRLPTFGGSSEVTCNAEKWNNIPFRSDEDGNGEPQRKVTYGRFSTTINAKARIEKSLHDEACDRIKSSLGIKD